MKLRTTFILLFISACLGSFIYFFEQKLPTSDELKKQSQFVFIVESTDIEKFQLQTQEVTILCERNLERDEWRITQPLNAKADLTIINSILGRLQSLKKKSDLGKIQSPDFGLQSPQLQVQFWTNGNLQKLLIGNKTPVGNQRYVMVGREEVFLVDESAIALFRKSLSDLRDRTLFEAILSQVTQIMIKRNEQLVVQSRKDEEGNWQIVNPVSYRGIRFKIEELIREAIALKVIRFAIEENSDLASLGLQAPAGEILLWTEGREEPQHLLLGKNLEGTQEVYAKLVSQDNVVLVSEKVSSILSKEILDLRDRQLFYFEADQLTQLEVTRDQQSWRFEKSEDQWQGKDLQLEHKVIQAMVRQLTFLKFLWLADGTDQEKNFPARETTVMKGWIEEGDPLFTLTIGRQVKEDPAFYVQTSGTEETYVLSSSQVDNLLTFLNK